MVLPGGVDDPRRPSGGNTYDRRLCDGLAALGWRVVERPVPGSWPWAAPGARAALREEVAAVPDGEVVLVDGLVGSTSADVLVPQADRVALVVLVHLPVGTRHRTAGGIERSTEEGAVLAAAKGVLTTSRWTRDLLVELYDLSPERVHAAEPGIDPVDPGGLAPGTPDGGELVCVASVTPRKGHDVLLEALRSVADLPWSCRCVGSLEVDAGFARDLLQRVRAGGLAPRMRFTGPRTGADLDAAYATSDVLVLASHAETYGMVVTEALARGLPVIATAVGGVPEALGETRDGVSPGILVPPGDPAALAAALRDWWGDPGLRERLRAAAVGRRSTLASWQDTAARVARVLEEASR